MKRAGVTSKAGFHTATSGAVTTEPIERTSAAPRSSMVMCAPSGVSGSKVDSGPAT